MVDYQLRICFNGDPRVIAHSDESVRQISPFWALENLMSRHSDPKIFDDTGTAAKMQYAYNNSRGIGRLGSNDLKINKNKIGNTKLKDYFTEYEPGIMFAVLTVTADFSEYKLN